MHTLHWIAVEAEDVQEAFDLVDSALTPEEGPSFANWSDWHIVGGGRWNVGENEDWKAAYVDGKTNMVISYKDNPAKFMENLSDIRQYRVTEMTRLKNDISLETFAQSMDSYIANNGALPEEERRTFHYWYVNKASDLLGEAYMPESFYFDIEYYSSSLSPLSDRLEKNPEQQYLVPVDFHY